MIETETLIHWARELCAFVNPSEPHPLFTAEDATPVPPEDRLPEETRTDEQWAALRKRAQKGLALLAKWQPTKQPDVPKRLVEMAADWLEDDSVRSTNAAYAFTPMDGVLSLGEDGRLQVVPRFRSPDAQYAVTFAELIQTDTPAMIRRCATCRNFFVLRRGARGQPRKLCDQHYEQSKQTKKTTTPRKRK